MFSRISYNLIGKWNLDIDFFKVLTYTVKVIGKFSLLFIRKFFLNP